MARVWHFLLVSLGFYLYEILIKYWFYQSFIGANNLLMKIADWLVGEGEGGWRGCLAFLLGLIGFY